MKNYESLRAMRDADFVGCCRRLLRTGRFSGAGELTRQAAQMAPKAYYIGYEHAYRELTRYRARGRFSASGRNSLGMWQSLRKDVEECQRRYALPLTNALARVLIECKPPRFFISDSQAAIIFRQARRRHHRHE